MRANVRPWSARAGCALRAVAKSDGYGWGVATLIDALDDLVEGYYVSDEDEFEAARALTALPIVTLVDVRPARVAAMLERNGVPTISRPEGIVAAERWALANRKRARIRLALRGAIGWSGVAPEELASVAERLSERPIDVELSAHITDASLALEQTEALDAALASLRAAHVCVVATDLESTFPLAAAGSQRERVRVGAGLFGARFETHLGVRSAIRVSAPVVEWMPAEQQRVGYGTNRAPAGGYLAVVRCGYGDGFPRVRDRAGGILAVGMQYTTVHLAAPPRQPWLALIDETTDLDALARSAEMPVHELILRLGAGGACGIFTRT